MCSFFKILQGSIAQLVEQRIENPCVGGSIPSRATFQRGTLNGFYTSHIINRTNAIFSIYSIIVKKA
jgi:hypothetical protein